MRERGLNFLQVPKSYYSDLRERLQHAKVKVSEDLDTVRRLRRTGLLAEIQIYHLVRRLRNFKFWLTMMTTGRILYEYYETASY